MAPYPAHSIDSVFETDFDQHEVLRPGLVLPPRTPFQCAVKRGYQVAVVPNEQTLLALLGALLSSKLPRWSTRHFPHEARLSLSTPWFVASIRCQNAARASATSLGLATPRITSIRVRQGVASMGRQGQTCRPQHPSSCYSDQCLIPLIPKDDCNPVATIKTRKNVLTDGIVCDFSTTFPPAATTDYRSTRYKHC